MKIKARLIFVLDKMRYRMKSCLLMIIMFSISFFALGIILFYQSSFSYSEESCDKVLTKGIEGTGVLYLDGEYYSEKGMEFCRKAQALMCIDSIGSISMRGRNDMPELYKIQAGHSEASLGEGELEIMLLDYTGLGLCELDFIEKKEIEPQKLDASSNWYALYLGAEYEDIPIGTTYEIEDITYEVMGKIKRGERFISSDMENGGAAGELSAYTVLDYAVLLISNDFLSSPFLMYSIEDGYQMEETQQKLEELADQMGLSVMCSSLSSNFKHNGLQKEKMKSIIMEVFVLVSIVVVIISISLQIVAFLNDSNEYGIFYAMGASEKDLQIMVLIENGIKNVLAFLISWMCLVLFVKVLFVYNEKTAMIADDIIKHGIVQWMLLFALGMTVLISIVPCLMLHYYPPVKLMKGKCI